MLRKLFITAVASVSLTAATTTFAQVRPPEPQQSLSTTLVQRARTQQGQYFSFALAPTFSASQESTNAIIIGSEKLCSMYGLMGWLGLPGGTGTRSVAALFGKCMQLQGVNVLSVSPLQPMNGFQQAESYDFTYTFNGRPFHATAVINVVSSGYAANAAVQFYACQSGDFETLRPALAKLSASIAGSNANTFGAQANFAATRPKGNYGIGDWKPYDASATNDRIFRHQSEEMLEYQNVHDPETGVTYQPTWDQYDPSRPGYANPTDPTQTLSNGPASDPEN